ncbi:hypothetical protein OAL10_01105 [Gammaproteobacteria bacterium]|nr:hypothetical protein [Gammaproteobacteria bacterium]
MPAWLSNENRWGYYWETQAGFFHTDVVISDAGAYSRDKFRKTSGDRLSASKHSIEC